MDFLFSYFLSIYIFHSIILAKFILYTHKNVYDSLICLGFFLVWVAQRKVSQHRKSICVSKFLKQNFPTWMKWTARRSVTTSQRWWCYEMQWLISIFFIFSHLLIFIDCLVPHASSFAFGHAKRMCTNKMISCFGWHKFHVEIISSKIVIIGVKWWSFLLIEYYSKNQKSDSKCNEFIQSCVDLFRAAKELRLIFILTLIFVSLPSERNQKLL